MSGTKSSDRVVFASGAAPVRCADAVSHGIMHEDAARERVGLACGANFYPVRAVARVSLDGYEVRVKPDGASDKVAANSQVLLEIKCPHARHMRSQIETRMLLDARQCLLELFAFPNAKCLVYAVLNYAPAGEQRNSNYDSALRRLDRADAMEALGAIRRAGCVEDFALDRANLEVGAILARMVGSATELPKLSDMGTAKAMKFLPELFGDVPASLQPHIAKGLRRDDTVGKDRELIAATGDQCIDGVPVSEFPRFFLRFAGRVAFYHFCLQRLPPEDADAMLGRCCTDKSDVQRTRSCLARILRGDSPGSPETSADYVFRMAAKEQNQPRAPPRSGGPPCPRQASTEKRDVT